ncbi:MAG: hypothetical protein M5U28_10465 [Sandaracinaceae bacterium]|nr:hypothetical protein [Sandaracinaceae bacterium]
MGKKKNKKEHKREKREQEAAAIEARRSRTPRAPPHDARGGDRHPLATLVAAGVTWAVTDDVQTAALVGLIGIGLWVPAILGSIGAAVARAIAPRPAPSTSANGADGELIPSAPVRVALAMVLVLAASGAASAQGAPRWWWWTTPRAPAARARERRIEESLGAPAETLGSGRGRARRSAPPPRRWRCSARSVAPRLRARVSRRLEGGGRSPLTRRGARPRRQPGRPASPGTRRCSSRSPSPPRRRTERAGGRRAATARPRWIPSRVVQAAGRGPISWRGAAPPCRRRSGAARALRGPRGRRGARVFLDDRRSARCPAWWRPPVGPHVVRVDAPRHASFAPARPRCWRAIARPSRWNWPDLGARRRGGLRSPRRARGARGGGGTLGALAAPRLRLAGVGRRGRRDQPGGRALRARGLRPPGGSSRAAWAKQLAGRPARADLAQALAWMDEATARSSHTSPGGALVRLGRRRAILAAAIAGAAALAQPQGPGPLGVTVVPNWWRARPRSRPGVS